MPFETTRRTTLALIGAVGTAALTGTAAGKPDEPASLKRFVQEPAGAEVTGLRVTPGGAMFLNAQHPSPDNPAPYDTHAIGSVYNFAGAAQGIENLPLQTGDAAKTLTVAGDYEHQVLAHGGDDIGDGRTFGVPVDANGDTMDDVMEPEVDMNVFVPTAEDETEGYLYTNFEAQPGMVCRMKISREDATSEWTVHEKENLDFRPVEGTWNNCNGWISPWGTPLSSEEYPSDAATWYDPDATTYGNAEAKIERYLGYFGNIYRYGYIVEVPEPTSEETPTPVKRYALGRLSHEVGLPMPDGRTVYLSDDWVVAPSSSSSPTGRTTSPAGRSTRRRSRRTRRTTQRRPASTSSGYDSHMARSPRSSPGSPSTTVRPRVRTPTTSPPTRCATGPTARPTTTASPSSNRGRPPRRRARRTSGRSSKGSRRSRTRSRATRSTSRSPTSAIRWPTTMATSSWRRTPRVPSTRRPSRGTTT